MDSGWSEEAQPPSLAGPNAQPLNGPSVKPSLGLSSKWWGSQGTACELGITASKTGVFRRNGEALLV